MRAVIYGVPVKIALIGVALRRQNRTFGDQQLLNKFAGW